MSNLLSVWVNVKVKTEELACSEDGGAVHRLIGAVIKHITVIITVITGHWADDLYHHHHEGFDC